MFKYDDILFIFMVILFFDQITTVETLLKI
jgi:hypothetical protein